MDHRLTVFHPAYGRRKPVGKKVALIPELMNGRPVYLGKYKELPDGQPVSWEGQQEALLITETVQADQRTLLKAGQILVSQRTYSKVKSLVDVEKVGMIQVQGLRDPVVTYNVKVPWSEVSFDNPTVFCYDFSKISNRLPCPARAGQSRFWRDGRLLVRNLIHILP